MRTSSSAHTRNTATTKISKISTFQQSLAYASHLATTLQSYSPPGSPPISHYTHHSRNYSAYTKLFSQIRCQTGDRVRIEAESKTDSMYGEIINLVPNDTATVRFDPYYGFVSPQTINLKNNKKTRIIPLTKAWLSVEFGVTAFDNKTQSFTITGWINVFWFLPTINDYKNPIEKYMEKNQRDINHRHMENMILFQNENQDIIMKIIDLRKEDRISHFLPLNAQRIFAQQSLISITHKTAPYLLYNTVTNSVRTQYHIVATLSEDFQLWWFPFDKQFLNVKLRWNTLYYHILDWKKEKNVPIKHHKIIDIRSEMRHSADIDIAEFNEVHSELVLLLTECTGFKEGISDIILSYLVHRICWFGDVDTKLCMRRIDAFYSNPIKIHIARELTAEISMLPPFVDFRVKKSCDQHDNDGNPSLRFAMIRLRFVRNPVYYVTYILLPFFLIVLCSFSVYAIPTDMDYIGGRLSVAVTVLLTFTAFQNVVGQQLPQTCFMEIIDWYIMAAYAIQALIILNVSVPSLMQYEQLGLKEHHVAYIEIICASLCFVFWIGFSLIYYGKRIFRGIFVCCCGCCGCRRSCKPVANVVNGYGNRQEKELVEFDSCSEQQMCQNVVGKAPRDLKEWVQRGQNQIEHWVQNTKVISEFYTISELLQRHALKK